MGFQAVEEVIQADGINEALRNSLWNILDVHIWTPFGYHKGNYVARSQHVNNLSEHLWLSFFKKRLDARPNYCSQLLGQIRKYFFSAEWYEAYDFTECLVQYHGREGLEKDLNVILERELAGYRFLKQQLIPITGQAEIESIQRALDATQFAGARGHLAQALSLLSDRENPDFRNSIKESISAVESLARELIGNPKATLGDALRLLEKCGVLHGGLKSGMSAIYGYTSDADGIRHGMLDEPHLDSADAKYYLVACSAFVNYLVEKHASAAQQQTADGI